MCGSSDQLPRQSGPPHGATARGGGGARGERKTNIYRLPLGVTSIDCGNALASLLTPPSLRGGDSLDLVGDIVRGRILSGGVIEEVVRRTGEEGNVVFTTRAVTKVMEAVGREERRKERGEKFGKLGEEVESDFTNLRKVISREVVRAMVFEDGVTN